MRHTISQYGRLTLEEARIEARKLLGVVAKGEDPARERRLQRVEAKLKARTVARHIKPLIGERLVQDGTPADIEPSSTPCGAARRPRP